MAMPKSIVLCGVKHCGKSTLGNLLADRFGILFFDTDKLLQKQHTRNSGEILSPREIFNQKGEDFFRRLEADVVRGLLDKPQQNRIVSLGGGVLSNPYIAPEELKKLGYFVYLDIDLDLAFSRVKRNGLPPFLINEKDPITAFLNICHQRKPIYLKYADLTFEIKADAEPGLVADELAKTIEEATQHERQQLRHTL